MGELSERVVRVEVAAVFPDGPTDARERRILVIKERDLPGVCFLGGVQAALGVRTASNRASRLDSEPRHGH